MSQIRRSWEKLTEEDKKVINEELILFFENERDEKIGVIAAEELLNFFLQTAGSKIYNQGINDAKKAFKYRMEELNYDLDELIEL